MKKILLTCVLLYGLLAGAFAQMYINKLPNLKSIRVSDDARLVINRGESNGIASYDSTFMKNDAEKEVRYNEQALHISGSKEYVLYLEKGLYDLHLEDFARVSIPNSSDFPFHNILMEDNSLLFVEKGGDTLRGGNWKVELEDKAKMIVLRPALIDELDLVTNDRSEFTTSFAFHVKTKKSVQRDGSSFLTVNDSVAKSISEDIRLNTNKKYNASYKITATDDNGDTIKHIKKDYNLSEKKEWESFFSDLGGDLYEIFSITSKDNKSSNKTKQKKNAKSPSFPRWISYSEFGISFLYWNGNAAEFSDLFSTLSPNSQKKDNISFFSVHYELTEHYQFNSHHALTMGLGLAWDNYRFNDLSFTNYYGKQPSVDKAKYMIRYVTVPVGYDFRNSHNFGLRLEVIPGYAWKAHSKLKFSDGNNYYKIKQKDMAYVNPFKLDARLTMTLNWGSIYFQPSLLPVLDNDGKESIYPVRAGFLLNIF